MTDKPPSVRELPWSTWYQLARQEMEFRHGLRRIPVDDYKEAYALCAGDSDIAHAVAQLVRQLQAKGRV
jgi:hypothetical protein